MLHPIVSTTHGNLLGIQSTTIEGFAFYNFSGIPYAEPPIGDLRFKDPVPIKGWKGIKNATKESSVCAQKDKRSASIIGGDDCLYLNVYTPQINVTRGAFLAVMVHVFGGAFVHGSGNAKDFGPDYLIAQDVVVVCFNYRLGVMGFLCTDPINARGDMAMKDQVLALQWVRKNIRAFGGDPDNVTIFGTSSAAASIEHLILSSKSAGLFHKAIIESASSLNPWSIVRNPLIMSERLARHMGYTGNSTEKIFSFINKFDTKEIIEASNELFFLKNELYDKKSAPFAPIVNPFPNYDGFLNEEPFEIVKKGNFSNIPIITGFCDNEGASVYPSVNQNYLRELKNGSFAQFIPLFMNKNGSYFEKSLKKIYTQKNGDRNELDYIFNFLSDLTYTSGILHSFKKRVEHNFIAQYFYLFTYDGNLNAAKQLLSMSVKGAIHGDNLGYYNRFDSYLESNSNDRLMRRQMVKLWTNFAKTGNPTPEISSLINIK